jgi:glucose/arabinose dehydrogenase
MAHKPSIGTANGLILDGWATSDGRLILWRFLEHAARLRRALSRMGWGATTMRTTIVAIACCVWTSALAQQAATPAPLTPDYAAVEEGRPIDARPPEMQEGKPLLPNQTRAPYHAAAPYRVTEITSGLRATWSLAFLPGGKFLVTERLPGTLRVIDQSGAIAPPVSGLEALNAGWPETGLFDVVVDRNFTRNRRIYFAFFGFDRGMISGLQVARATFDEAANSISDVRVIFRARPQTPNDNRPGVGSRAGGRMVMGPDGYLYLTVGDRDAGGSYPWLVAQTLDTHLGKILRITTDGKPAPGNPFIGRDGAYPEIWAIGHRNPQGLAFDREGRLWETEHGPRGGDELNLIRRAANYGWPVISYGIDYAGPAIGGREVARGGMEQPVYYWSPSVAPSGLAFYKGDLFPDWKNSVFLGTLRGKALVRLTLSGGKVVDEEVLLTDVKMRVREVQVGPDGAVYVLTDTGNGNISNDTPIGSKLLKLTPR